MSKINLNDALSYIQDNKAFKVEKRGSVKIKIGDNQFASRRKIAKLILENGTPEQKETLKELFNELKGRINAEVDKSKHTKRLHRFLSWLGRLSYNYEKKLEKLSEPRHLEVENELEKLSEPRTLEVENELEKLSEPRTLEDNQHWRSWQERRKVEDLIRCVNEMWEPLTDDVKEALFEASTMTVRDRDAGLFRQIVVIMQNRNIDLDDAIKCKLQSVVKYEGAESIRTALNEGTIEEKWEAIFAAEYKSYDFAFNAPAPLLLELPALLMNLWDNLSEPQDKDLCERKLSAACKRLKKWTGSVAALTKAYEYSKMEHPALKNVQPFNKKKILTALANHPFMKNLDILTEAIGIKKNVPLKWYIKAFKLGDISMSLKIEFKLWNWNEDAIKSYKEGNVIGAFERISFGAYYAAQEGQENKEKALKFLTEEVLSDDAKANLNGHWYYLMAKLTKNEDHLQKAADLGHELAKVLKEDDEFKKAYLGW